MENTLWTEKYRPGTFEDIKGQKNIVKRVKAFVEQKNMPHLLFAGPAGTGKTSLSLVIAKQLFGPNWKQNILELNASDERGIDVVRVKVKNFARTRSIGNTPYKIIYLDESDALTREAQQALRRTMENYSKTCRFILSCNYSSKIIDPIQSRCAVFHFKPLKKEDVYSLINKVAQKENVMLTEKAIEKLITISQGDCRKMENLLQSASITNKEIDENVLAEISGMAEPKEIQEIIKLAQNDFVKAREKLQQIMLDKGLSGLDVIKQIHKEIWNADIENRLKMKLINKIAETEFRITEGSDEILQLEAFLAYTSYLADSLIRKSS